MPNKIQPRQKESIDEETIEQHLEDITFGPSEDIMTQNERVEVEQLGNVDKQASSADDVQEQGK